MLHYSLIFVRRSFRGFLDIRLQWFIAILYLVFKISTSTISFLPPFSFEPCGAEKCTKTTNVQTTTFAQTFRPQMCKSVNHICANISPSNVQTTTICANTAPSNVQICKKKKNKSTTKTWRRQMCKGSNLTWNVRTSHKCANHCFHQESTIFMQAFHPHVQTTTFVQIRRPQMYKSVLNTSTANVQTKCAKVQFDVKCATDIPQMFSSRISLLKNENEE